MQNMKTNWQIKKLGDVCKLQGGFAFKSEDYKNTGIPLVRIQNLQDNLIDTHKAVFISENKKDELKNFLLKENDILIAMSGATTGKMAIVKKIDLPLFLNQRVGRFVVDSKVLNNDYLWYFLNLIKESFLEQAYGGAQPNISPSKIENLEIPLPSLEIQKEIVVKLDEKFTKLREAKKLREDSLADTDKILSQTLREIFEEGKQKFNMANLGNVATLVRGPFGGSLKKEIFVPEGIAVYEQGNVIDSVFSNFRYFVTKEKFEEMKRFEVSEGDILMSCSGTIGKFIIIPTKFTKGIINQALLKITPKKTIGVKYLKYALQDYLSLSTTHIKGGAIKNIASVKELKQFSIPLPSLSEQQKIVTKLDELSEKISDLIELQKSQFTDLKQLEKTYLREAFNDELV
jgi:type I restriction enzyme S subunit